MELGRLGLRRTWRATRRNELFVGGIGDSVSWLRSAKEGMVFLALGVSLAIQTVRH